MSEIAGPGPAFSDITRPAPEGAGPARVAALSGKNPFHVHPWITVSLRVRDTCSKRAVVGGRNKTAKSHKRRGVAKRCVRNGSPAVSLGTSETWLPSPMGRTPHAPPGELRPGAVQGRGRPLHQRARESVETRDRGAAASVATEGASVGSWAAGSSRTWPQPYCWGFCSSVQSESPLPALSKGAGIR